MSLSQLALLDFRPWHNARGLWDVTAGEVWTRSGAGGRGSLCLWEQFWLRHDGWNLDIVFPALVGNYRKVIAGAQCPALDTCAGTSNNSLADGEYNTWRAGNPQRVNTAGSCEQARENAQVPVHLKSGLPEF